MKRFVFGIILIPVFVFGMAPVFAQAQNIDEQSQIIELQALLLQLFQRVLELQQQLYALQLGRISSVPIVPSAPVYACGQAEITWAKVSGATGYALYRNGLEVYSGKNLKFQDTGLVSGATYAYTLRAQNAGGLGPASPIETITMPSVCPPASPTVWAQPGMCGGTVQVLWASPTGDVFYEVYRGNARVFGGGTLTFIDRGLSVGRTYTYKVRAGNAGGWGEYSEQISVVASGVCPPAAPLAPEVESPSLEGFASEGILTLAIQGSPSGVTAESGAGANILSFRIEAVLSAMVVERADVEFTDRPWLFLSEVEVRDGSNTVGRVSITEGSFSRTGDNRYRLSFTGLNVSIAKDRSKVLTVRITAKEDLALAEPRQMIVSIPEGSVRTRDQIGVMHTGPLAEQATSFAKTFYVKKK